MRKVILFLWILFLPTVLAVTIPDGWIYSASGIKTNVTFNVTRYADSITVESTGIYFAGYRSSLLSTDKITFNVTESNLHLYVNSTQEDLPYIYSNNVFQAVIPSKTNVNDTIIYLDHQCGNDGKYQDVSSLRCTNCVINSWGCDNDDTITVHANLTNNTNTITYTLIPAINEEESCGNSPQFLVRILGFLAGFSLLIGALILFGALRLEGEANIGIFISTIFIIIFFACIISIMAVLFLNVCI